SRLLRERPRADRRAAGPRGPLRERDSQEGRKNGRKFSLPSFRSSCDFSRSLGDEQGRDVLAVAQGRGPRRQDLVAVSGHQDRVLELGAQAAVRRTYGPLVARVDLDLPAAGVHHRLDRERHSRAQALAAPAGPVVLHLRGVVELAPDAVTDEVAHHPATLTLDVLLDRRANVAEASAVAHLLDPD